MIRPYAFPNPACPPTQGSVLTPGWTYEQSASVLDFIEEYGIAEMERVWVQAVNDARRLLPSYGYKLTRGPLGSGHFGVVYAIENDPGWVVKITGDFSEAAAWAHVGKVGWRNFPALARVECVVALPTEYGEGRRMYAIVQEYLEPLDDPARIFISVHRPLILCAAGDAGACKHKAVMATPAVARADVHSRAKEAQYEGVRSYMLAPSNIEDLLLTIANLRSIGVRLVDVHGDNVMYEPTRGTLKITDLGMVGLPATAVPLARGA